MKEIEFMQRDHRTAPRPGAASSRREGAPRVVDVDPEWAWAPFSPGGANRWDAAAAAHLLRRASFGFTATERQRAVAEGPQATVARLLQPVPEAADFDGQFDAWEEHGAGSAAELAAWWLRRMLESPRPLVERMTLFWRECFPARTDRVGEAGLVVRQVQQLRRDALGRFDVLLRNQLHQPAVLLAWGGGQNRRSQPNHQLARALLHGFTVGPGVAGDRDVTETARALTGWFVRRGKLQFVEREQDPAPKCVLEQDGVHNLDDLLAGLAHHEATSRHVARRLWRTFISEVADPSPTLLQALADFLAADRDLAATVGRVLSSNLFHAPESRLARAKSPVELAVGLARGLEGVVPTEPLAGALRELGQDLANPPSLDGWPRGTDWINGATLALRCRLTASLLGANDRYKRRLDPAAVARRHWAVEDGPARRFIAGLLFPDLETAARPEWRDFAGDLRDWAIHLTARPEYQLL